MEAKKLPWSQMVKGLLSMTCLFRFLFLGLLDFLGGTWSALCVGEIFLPTENGLEWYVQGECKARGKMSNQLFMGEEELSSSGLAPPVPM